MDQGILSYYQFGYTTGLFLFAIIGPTLLVKLMFFFITWPLQKI